MGDHGEIAVELHQGGQGAFLKIYFVLLHPILSKKIFIYMATCQILHGDTLFFFFLWLIFFFLNHKGLGLVPGVDEALYNTSGKYSTRLYAEIASQWIHEHDQQQPMFLYLPFQGAHSANNKYVQAPADLIRRFDKTISNKTCGQWETPLTTRKTAGTTGEEKKGDNINCDKSAMRKTIAATVVAVDEAVGTVVNALKEVGMYNNTLIVFSTGKCSRKNTILYLFIYTIVNLTSMYMKLSLFMDSSSYLVYTLQQTMVVQQMEPIIT